MIKIKLLTLLSIVLFLFSCQSTPKNITYFQDLDPGVAEKYLSDFQYEPIIKNNDQLLISVSSPTLNQELVAQFNLPTTSFMVAGETQLAQTSSMQTYTVDTEGFINYPVLGKIKMAGLTKSDAIKSLSTLVSEYLENPIVNLQIVSFQVTVLGEVNRPGVVRAANERLSVLDAIGGAGDLTIFGCRENILLIRENNGKKQYAYFDMTKSDLFSSPYYYLQQNDVLVVEANDARKRASKFGAAENYNLSVYSVIASSVSIIASTVIAIISLNK